MKIIKCPCGKKVKVLYKSQEGRKKYCSKQCKNDNYIRPLGIKSNFVNGNKGWFKKGENKGIKHWLWAGNKVSYNALHAWLYREKGKAIECKECGSKKNVQWANKSKKYLRKLNDWIPLCGVCHRRFDGITKLSKLQANDIKMKYKWGNQKELAKKYKVDQATISNIINNKIKYYIS